MKTPAEIAAEVVGIYEDRRHIKGRTLTKRVAEAIAERDKRADALAEALREIVKADIRWGVGAAENFAELQGIAERALAAYAAEAK